jgi:spoIIIJ-associated protein
MESAEASGKTVEDALNRALEKLGASRDEVEFTVLDEGKRGGLFGRGKDAVVRVDRLAEGESPAPPVAERPDTTTTRSAPAAGGRPSRPRGERGGARSGGGGGRSREGLDQPVPRLSIDDFLRPGESAPAAGDRRPQRGGARSSSRGPRPERPARPPSPRPEGAPRGERRRREDQPEIAADIDAESVDFAAQVVDDLLRLMDIDAELTIREPLTPGDGRGVVKAVIDINGDGLGLLIGRRGDTLFAFQYLVNLVVGRRFPDDGGVTIDVEHCRHRREEQIVSLARRMADRVKQTGSPITLEPMPPSERRLVHLSLAEDPELSTNSIGEGETRKVVISIRE